MTLPPAYGTRVDLSWVFSCRHQLFRGHQPIKLENFEAQSLESDASLPNIHTFDAKVVGDLFTMYPMVTARRALLAAYRYQVVFCRGYFMLCLMADIHALFFIS